MSGVGIDTNVLLRMVFNEDAVQRAKALEFGRTLSPDNPGFVSLIVVVELNWALSSVQLSPILLSHHSQVHKGHKLHGHGGGIGD